MSLRKEFQKLVEDNISREGIEPLMNWLGNTDFFEAPASTKFHDNFEGGLVAHSIAVYYYLSRLCQHFGIQAPEESIAICALFHDVCKAGCYKIEMRWRKDKNDRWEQSPVYTFKEDYPFGGHGAKSVYLIQHFMDLNAEEAAAINSHMGQWDATTYSNPTAVYEVNPLAWLLHVADEAATFLGSIEVPF